METQNKQEISILGLSVCTCVLNCSLLQCHYTHHCPLFYRALCYATVNLILYIITFHHRFEVIFPTPKEVDELGENWRDEIRTLLGYEGSGDQLLGRAAASIDSKLGHGGRKNRCA